MWEDEGYELYEFRESQWVAYGAKGEIGAPLRKRLDFREMILLGYTILHNGGVGDLFRLLCNREENGLVAEEAELRAGG